MMTNNDDATQFLKFRLKISAVGQERTGSRNKTKVTNLWWLLDSTVFCAKKPLTRT